MASTVTRAAWTDDSGTPSSPVGDGTLINNARLQADVYDKIDQMFAGGVGYTTFTFGGVVAAQGFGSHTFSAGGTGFNTFILRNTTAGTGNASRLALGNDATAALLDIYGLSSTFTPTGQNLANGVAINANGVGGMSFTAGDAAGVLRFYTGGANERMRINAAGQVFVGDTSDGDLSPTGGLCVSMGSGAGSALTLKNSNISHSTGGLEADTFGALSPHTTTTGGLVISGFAEAGHSISPVVSLTASGDSGTGDTSKATTSQAYVVVRPIENNTTVGANENLLAVINYTTTRFILDAEGDSHQDVGTAWTNFDDHDDVELLHALSAGVSRADDPLREAFGSFLQAHRGTLERARIVTFNDDGHHFINWSRTHMLMIGAVRQLGARVSAQATEIAELRRLLPAGA